MIMKGFYPSEKNTVKSFLKGRGFYLILLLCIIGVGVLGYVSLKGLNDPGDEYINNSKNTSHNSTGDDISDPFEEVGNHQSGVSYDSSSSSISDSSSSSSNSKTESEISAEVFAVNMKKIPVVYSMPLKGTILNPYAETAKSVTLDAWVAHTGVDIKGKNSDQVMAAAYGTVTDAGYTEDMGYTVVIKHADGAKTVYSCLSPTLSVKKGDRVRAGQVIGGVGNTASFEVETGDHLHFSVINKDGGHVDPINFIKKK